MAAYRPVGLRFSGWGLVAKIDSAEAYRPVDRLRWLLLGLGGAALALGLGASNAIARRFRATDPPAGENLVGGRGRRSRASGARSQGRTRSARSARLSTG